MSQGFTDAARCLPGCTLWHYHDIQRCATLWAWVGVRVQVRRGWALLRAIHQVEVLAQLQPGSRQLATSRGMHYEGAQNASETVQLAYKLAPDNDPAVLEFALATSLHHDGITGMYWLRPKCYTMKTRYTPVLTATQV